MINFFKKNLILYSSLGFEIPSFIRKLSTSVSGLITIGCFKGKYIFSNGKEFHFFGFCGCAAAASYPILETRFFEGHIVMIG